MDAIMVVAQELANKALTALRDDTQWPEHPKGLFVYWAEQSGYGSANDPLDYASSHNSKAKPLVTLKDSTSKLSHYENKRPVIMVRKYLVQVFLDAEIKVAGAATEIMK